MKGATFGEVFAVREFRVLFGSFVLLVGGDSIKMLALSVLVYTRTGSPGLSAAAYMAGWLPFIVGGLFLLSLADRLAPRALMVAGELIRKGETVALSLPAINRDPGQFADPGELRLDRAEARRHLSFGHGVHQCLGQQLARIEMRIGYRRLFERFPGLRLAVPASDVPLKERSGVYGVESLPVTW